MSVWGVNGRTACCIVSFVSSFDVAGFAASST